jgi:hypothetical protein
MTIKYKFEEDGNYFEYGSFDYFVKIHNYNDVILIICNDNNFTSLPNLPTSLKHLYCYNNNLTVLPSLPNGLINLFCENNKLIELPVLPESLIHLYCYNNQLQFLPILPNSLSNLYCYKNKIQVLPKFSDSIKYKDYSDNPVDTYIKDECDGDLKIYHRKYK